MGLSTAERDLTTTGWRMWLPIVLGVAAAVTLPSWRVWFFPTSLTAPDELPLLFRLLPAFVRAGLVFGGPLIGALWSRATPRVGMTWGVIAGASSGALVGAKLVFIVLARDNVDLSLSSGVCVGALLVLLVTCVPAMVVGAAGGSLGGVLGGGARLAGASDPSEVAAAPVLGWRAQLLAETLILRADLNDTRRLDARQRTVVFHWSQDLESYARANDIATAELGLDSSSLEEALSSESKRSGPRIAAILTATADALAQVPREGYRHAGTAKGPIAGS